MKSQRDLNDRLAVIQRCWTWLHLTENWIYTQVRHLPDRIESHIVCEEARNVERFRLPNMHCRLSEPTLRYVFVYGLRRLRIRRRPAYLTWVARRYRASVLHSHFGHQGWLDIEPAREARLKHVVSFYGMDATLLPKQEPIWQERYRVLFAHVDGVLCEGPHMAQCLVKLGCPEGKVRVHRLGVRLDEIPFKPRSWSRGEPLRVLIAASFREKKGIPYALEALAQLQEKVALEITIIGDATDDAASQAEKQKIRDVMNKHDLQSKTRLLGYQPHTVLHQEAKEHHVFVSPSVTADSGDTEGGAPVSIIEMAATGMPVVSTTHCDIPEVIENGVTGLLAKERDTAGLVDRLNWLIENTHKWQPMVEASRKHIESGFDARKQGEELAALYEELAES